MSLLSTTRRFGYQKFSAGSEAPLESSKVLKRGLSYAVIACDASAAREAGISRRKSSLQM